jgi:hypothetical protein
MFHLFHIDVAFKCFMLQVFHAIWRLKGRGGVIEARHTHQGMNHGELEADRQGTQRIGVQQMRRAAGPTVKAQRERGARAGQGE